MNGYNANWNHFYTCSFYLIFHLQNSLRVYVTILIQDKHLAHYTREKLQTCNIWRIIQKYHIYRFLLQRHTLYISTREGWSCQWVESLLFSMPGDGVKLICRQHIIWISQFSLVFIKQSQNENCNRCFCSYEIIHRENVFV